MRLKQVVIALAAIAAVAADWCGEFAPEPEPGDD